MIRLKIFAITLVLIFMCSSAQISYAKTESLVDKTVYNSPVLEEYPDDEFINDKRELNRLFDKANKNGVDDNLLHEIFVKIQDLKNKINDKYPKPYVDYSLAYASDKLLSLSYELTLVENFQIDISDNDENALKQALKSDATWKALDEEFNKTVKSFAVPLEFNFRIDKQSFDICKKHIGESEPTTLKNALRLIKDYSLMGDSKTALEMEKNVFPKIKKIFGEKSSEIAEVLELIANDYKVLGNYAKSEEALLQALEINKKIYGEESSSKVLSNLIGLSNLRRVVLTKEDSLYKAIEKAAKNIPESDLYRLGYFRSKILSSPEHDIESFINFESTIEKEERALSATSFRGDYYTKRADALSDSSKYSRRLGIYEYTFDKDLISLMHCMLNFGNNHYRTLEGLCNLSDDYLNLNQIDDALKLVNDALKTSQKIYGEEHPCTIRAIHSLSNFYRKLGKYSEALELDQKAYRLCKKVFVKSSVGEPLETLTVLEDIANDYRGLKNYAAAIKYEEELLSKSASSNFYEFPDTEIRKNLAQMYNLTGEYEKTIALYNFLKTDDGLYSLDKLPKITLSTIQTAEVLGEALEVSERNTSASSLLYSQVINGYEDLRYLVSGSATENRRSVFTGFVPSYKKTAEFFIRQNDAMSAFRAIELCKARILMEQYRDLLAIYQGGLNDEESSKMLAYKKNIEEYQNAIKSAVGSRLKLNLRTAQFAVLREYFSYQKLLQNKYPKYKSLLIQGTALDKQAFNSEQIKKIISHNHCYITFSVIKKENASDEILACAVDETGMVNGVSIKVDDKFFDECNLYHELLAYINVDDMNRDNKFLWRLSDGSYKITNTRDEDNFNAVRSNEELRKLRQELSATIGEKLLAPLSDYIETKTNWIISPDGELNNIPFETLLFNGKMVIESVDVNYVPSLAVLRLMREVGEKNSQIQNRRELFAMGDAVYGSHSVAESRKSQKTFLQNLMENPNAYVDLTKIKWMDLEHANEAIEEISAPLLENTREVLKGVNASEKILKQRDKDGQLSQYKYILFAAHGMFLPEKPELSSIVLSQELGDENFDGYVTIGEWFGYNLNSDLVYLSACESGLGDYQSGEGIIGLPYALTIAGNKDTIMSLWKVKDDTAAKFAVDFFKKLNEGKTEVQALNETKREFIKNPNTKFNSPSIWAAFLLYGV